MKFYQVAINAETSKYIKLDEILSFQNVGDDNEFIAVIYKNGSKETFMAGSLISAFAHAEIGIMSMQVGEPAAE